MATWGSATVIYSASDQTLNDVLSIEIEQGRQWTTDPYDAARMVIQCRNLSAWPSPNPRIGQRIKCNVTFSSLANNYFIGRITDVVINYGNKTSMDTATITCEGALGYLARRTLTSQSLTQKNTTQQAYDATVASGVPVTAAYDAGLSIASAQTYTGNLLDLVNKLVVGTEYGRIKQYGSTTATQPSIKFVRRNLIGNSWAASDVRGVAYEILYDTIGFTSGQDNHYTQVTVQPQGLTNQVATDGSNYYGLTVDSLDYTNGQALSHAQYLLSNFSNIDAEIASISFKLSAQQAASALERDDWCTAFSSERQVATEVAIAFRGTTYRAITEGFRITITPDDVEFVVYFSPQDTNAYMILNNSIYGRLDYNKLGF